MPVQNVCVPNFRRATLDGSGTLSVCLTCGGDGCKLCRFSETIPCLACGGDGCGLCRYADCAVCLGTSSSPKNVPVSLHCGHTFCKNCLQTHLHTQLEAGQLVSCPVCRKEFGHEDIMASGCEPKPIKQTVAVDHELDARIFHVESTFRRAARQGHWRLCPACGVGIAKEGGCRRMQCRCGHRFHWRSAPLVEPCTSIHCNQTGYHVHGCTLTLLLVARQSRRAS